MYRPGETGKFDLNLGFTDSDDRKIVAANRESLVSAAAEGKDILGLVTLRQIHSSLIRRVQAKDVHEYETSASLKGDGLMTDEPGVFLGIQTADCIPILVADRKRRAVAAFHAGWRGTLARIVENGVGRMRLEFGSQAKRSDRFHRPRYRAVLLCRRRRSAAAIRIAIYLRVRAVS